MHKIFWIGITISAALVLAVLLYGAQREATAPTPSPKVLATPEPAGPDDKLLSLGKELEHLSLAQTQIGARTPFAAAGSSDMYKHLFLSFITEANLRASQIDKDGTASDLACIFRGMPIDAREKLATLETSQTAGEQAAIWQNAAYLFADVSAVLKPNNTRLAGVSCPSAPLGDGALNDLRR